MEKARVRLPFQLCPSFVSLNKFQYLSLCFSLVKKKKKKDCGSIIGVEGELNEILFCSISIKLKLALNSIIISLPLSLSCYLTVLNTIFEY